MSAPVMAGWNLALRFVLELVALAGLAMLAWGLTPGAARWLAVVVVPVAAAAAWGVFNVVGDPSRSGGAPVEVSGWSRLGLELVVLGTGAVALAIATRPVLGVAAAVMIGIHYAASWQRLTWLVDA